MSVVLGGMEIDEGFEDQSWDTQTRAELTRKNIQWTALFTRVILNQSSRQTSAKSSVTTELSEAVLRCLNGAQWRMFSQRLNCLTHLKNSWIKTGSTSIFRCRGEERIMAGSFPSLTNKTALKYVTVSFNKHQFPQKGPTGEKKESRCVCFVFQEPLEKSSSLLLCFLPSAWKTDPFLNAFGT